MRSIEFKYLHLLIFLFILIMSGCSSNERSNSNIPVPNIEEEEITHLKDSVITRINKVNGDSISADTVVVIVVQCANGYEYAMFNYDFNPIVESELGKFSNIEVLPFPLTKLMGVPYQGVFDIKYCTSIIEKVNVDYLILTRFAQRLNARNQTEMDWGYELRIVNTKTLEQLNSVRAHNLKGYEQIGLHIKENIGTLKSDIEKFE